MGRGTSLYGLIPDRKDPGGVIIIKEGLMLVIDSGIDDSNDDSPPKHAQKGISLYGADS